MRFDAITLFPEWFDAHLTSGIARRAYDLQLMSLKRWQLRDFAPDRYRRVDDRPYGGGPGMVMLVEPLERALTAIQKERESQAPVILFTPTGPRLNQRRVEQFVTQSQGAIFVCGRYEGIDQRFIDRHVDEEMSVGDLVLSGGEIPALMVLDAVARLLPGVLSAPESHQQDSFSQGLLDCPHYSRPEKLEGPHGEVPPVLMSGNHELIAQWRRQQSLRLTLERRPELIVELRQSGGLTQADEKFLRSLVS